jgi:alpha-L-arabinofuranosidase
MTERFTININPDQTRHDVSQMLFGLFLEDINFSCDGGLNANMVNNFSFDGIYLNRKGYSDILAFIFKPEPRAVYDRLRYWNLFGGSMKSFHEDPVAENSWYAHIEVKGQCRLENFGYNGLKCHSDACAMSIRAGQDYKFSCWIRSRNYVGEISVSVRDDDGKPLTEAVQLTPADGWQEWTLLLLGIQTGYGKLVVQFNGQGEVDLDGVSLMTTDTWGKGDPKWSQGKLRRDLVEVLHELKPRFLRFPGGCIVEGSAPGNEYNWKDTVGPVINRKGKYNLWAGHIKDGGYNQSFQVGFYEYFLLCEDLGMEPLPTLFAGINCQVRSKHVLDSQSVEFQNYVVQNYLDLIEFANGDPDSNLWAALRAQAGHPQPFGLKYIGIGNENFGEDYLEKFAEIKTAIAAQYPGITCVLSAGLNPAGKSWEAAWDFANKKFPDVLVDEHCYDRPKWFIEGYHRYDNYDRNGAKVYMGEYAANFPLGVPILSLKPNCYQTALGEAVFLAGIEHNSDVVAMSSYAPLFSLSEGEQWPHNLINFNPAHVLLTANYYVQKLFSTTVGDKVIIIQGDLPAGVYASATVTEEQVIVKLINTNANPILAQLSLSGISDGDAQVVYLQSDDLKAVNTLSFHGTPHYLVKPKAMARSILDGTLMLELMCYGFYVLTLDRGN